MKDDRDTARTWASMIYVALRHCIKTDHRGADLDVAFVIHEANALRITAQIACENSGDDFEELLSDVRQALDGNITKLARDTFQKRRIRWDEIDADNRSRNIPSK